MIEKIKIRISGLFCPILPPILAKKKKKAKNSNVEKNCVLYYDISFKPTPIMLDRITSIEVLLDEPSFFNLIL